MREVEELVFHGIAECGFDLHFLECRGISIHAHGERQGFVVHELMQALHGSGCAAFGFQRNDPAVTFHHEVYLADSAVFPPPVEELSPSRGLAYGGTELLSDALLSQSATKRRRHIRPSRKGISSWRVPERVRQSDIQKSYLSQTIIDFPSKRHAVALRVGDRIAELGHAQQIERVLGLLMLHTGAHKAVDKFIAQLIDNTAQDIVQDSRIHAAGVFGKGVSICLDEIALQPTTLAGLCARRISRHHLGHSTGHEIPVVKFHRHRMRGIAQRKAGRPLCQSLQESLLTMRLQKLRKRHWLHKSEGNPAHRHAVFKIPKREFQ